MAERIELLERPVADLDLARAIRAMADRNGEAERLFQSLFQSPRIRVLHRFRLARRRALGLAARLLYFRQHNHGRRRLYDGGVQLGLDRDALDRRAICISLELTI